MTEKNSQSLFNGIAPIYNLFYHFQKRSFRAIIANAKSKLDLTQFGTVLDVGCGTGALCSVLNQVGLKVTGVDPAHKMLNLAKNRIENSGILFIEADARKPLPFQDSSFDLCIASYVAHGMPRDDRRRLYEQMSRVAKKLVIIHDYNGNRSLLTTAVEWLEQGDYFHFIKQAQTELKDCVTEMKTCFSDVKVIDVGTRTAWYICTPTK